MRHISKSLCRPRKLAAFYPPDYHSMTHAGLLNKIRNDMRIRHLSKLVIDEGVISTMVAAMGHSLSRLPRVCRSGSFGDLKSPTEQR